RVDQPAKGIQPPTPAQAQAIQNAYIRQAKPVTGVPVVNAVPGQPVPAPAPVLANAPGMAMAPAANPYASPTVVFDASALPAPAAAVVAAAQGATVQGAGTGSASDFASRLGGVGGAPATARSDIDPKTTVTQGTMIPA